MTTIITIYFSIGYKNTKFLASPSGDKQIKFLTIKSCIKIVIYLYLNEKNYFGMKNAFVDAYPVKQLVFIFTNRGILR